MATLYRWDTLQLHHGSPENSFELLCALLAERDQRFATDPRNRFIRNGRPDGGVECYWELADSSIHGYQAKYHRQALGASQWSQLKSSIDTALKTHPKLTGITVCIPQDLPDSPQSRPSTSARRRTSRATWEQNRVDWQATASRSHPGFTIDMWDDTAIASRIQDPRSIGLLKFFFEPDILTPDKVKQHVDAQIARVGPRYQPALHVTHPFEELFEWLTMTSDFRDDVISGLRKVRSLLHRDELAVLAPTGKSLVEHVAPLVVALDALVVALSTTPMRAIDRLARVLSETLHDAVFGRLYEHRPDYKSSHKSLTDTERYAIEQRWRRLEALANTLSKHLEPLGGEAGSWQFHPACDGRFVALSGSGGCGKTHLLCDFAQRLATREQPVALLLGQSLDASRFGTDRLLNARLTLTNVLEWLDTAGAINGCRGILVIDALNEAENSQQWQAELRALASLISYYPHVAVLVSVRDSYADYSLPTRQEVPSLLRVEHEGFAGQRSQALRTYCSHYNVALPDVPVLNPEFDNPLFLSMFCQAIAGLPDPSRTRHTVSFPGGHMGFGDVFDKFIDFRERSLVAQFDLDLDASRRPLRDALGAIAERASSSPTLDVSLADATAIARTHLQGGSLRGNILTRLEADGLLLRVPRWLPDGTCQETVRFAYDRMGSHFVVAEWLKGHATPESACAALLGPNGRLRDVSGGRTASTSMPSLCEELVLQWPERYQSELFEVRREIGSNAFWQETFLRAARGSSPARWTDSTARWLLLALEELKSEPNEQARWIAALLCRIGHPALIETVHGLLVNQALATRDAGWTIWSNDSFGESHEAELVTWPLEHDAIRLSEVQAISYATSLAWLTTTTRRKLRSYATKAITAVLDSRLSASATLLARFQSVNDPYVLQAVSLAVYGACLRSSDAGAVRTVGEAVRAIWPRKERFPVDVITRHALSGIVEVAGHRSSLFGITLAEWSPPYGSDWISTPLKWQEIERLAEAESATQRYSLSAIVDSCIPDGHRTDAPRRMYGNFGRYTVSSAVSGFLPHHYGQGQPPAPAFEFDLPHRFIITRVLELGWTTEAFEEFDRSCRPGDRGRNAAERIGKKYQWIALSEFLARAADRYPLVDRGWPEPARRAYRSPDDVHQYFFADTSLLRLSPWKEPGTDISATRHNKSFWDEPSDDKWLLSPQGFADPSEFLIQQATNGTEAAVLLRGHCRWKEDVDEGRPEADRRYRTVSLSIAAFAIRQGDLSRVEEWFHLNKANDVPGPSHYREVLFGELYWSRGAMELSALNGEPPEKSWIAERSHAGDLPVDVLSLASEYSTESDDSVDGRLASYMPCRWLAERLELRSGPQEFTFTDAKGRVIGWRGSPLRGDKLDGAYIRMEQLKSVLDREGLQLVWGVIGEKMAIQRNFGDKGPYLPFLQGLYWLDNGRIVGWSGVEFDEAFRNGHTRMHPPGFSLSEVFRTNAEKKSVPTPTSVPSRRGRKVRPPNG